jgi:hypothetical protein
MNLSQILWVKEGNKIDQWVSLPLFYYNVSKDIFEFIQIYPIWLVRTQFFIQLNMVHAS